MTPAEKLAESERAHVLAEARAIVARIEGRADDGITARQARALGRKLEKLAKGERL